MPDEVSFICWNCREARSRKFLCKMKDLIKEYCPRVIILLEPRISSAIADDVCTKLGKRNWARSYADGFNGRV